MSSGMPSVPVPASTLVGTLWPTRESAPAAALRAAVLMLVGTALLALSAKIQVPFYPVPMTLQTLVVLVIGAAYGWRLGGATVALYLAEGAMGLPVFANTPPAVPGPAYFMGPTGGFLFGFVAAAMVAGFLAERGWNGSLWRVLALMTIGHAVLFVVGLAWLGYLIGPAKAWMAGFMPFVAATIVKTALAAALMHAAWGFTRRDEAKR